MSDSYTAAVPMGKVPRTPWLMAVGERFRRLRKHAKKNQDELGASPTTIGKLEDGYGANLSTIETACTMLGIDPWDIFKPRGENASAKKVVRGHFSAGAEGDTTPPPTIGNEVEMDPALAGRNKQHIITELRLITDAQAKRIWDFIERGESSAGRAVQHHSRHK